MNLRLSPLAAAGLLSAAISCQAAIDRVVDKTFTVQPGGSLTVDTSGGSIRVDTGAGNEVKVEAKEHIHADSDQEADDILKHLDLEITQNGGDVAATARYTGEHPMFSWGSWPPVNVSFVVTVPARYAAQLHTSGGSITVGSLGGSLKAHTSGGALVLGKIAGKIDGSTSGGSVTLTEGLDDIRLETSGGGITVDHAVGPANLHTSGGSIKVAAAENTVNAHTSAGSIFAAFVGPLKGDCTLGTSAGSVRAILSKDSHFHLNAETSAGGVVLRDFPITIEGGGQHKEHLVGQIGDGGPTLRLRTSAGGISVSSGG